MKKQKTVKFTLIIIAVISRLFPHLPNFTPLNAAGIFSGTYLTRKQSFLVVLLSMIISDYLLLYINPYSSKPINFSQIYSPFAAFHSTTFFVYGSMLLNVLIGWQVAKNKSAKSIVTASLAASVQFFIITNFGVWVTGGYSQNLEGLVQSYIMGLPFFRWALLGDLFYTVVLYSTYELAMRLGKARIKVSIDPDEPKV